MNQERTRDMKVKFLYQLLSTILVFCLVTGCANIREEENSDKTEMSADKDQFETVKRDTIIEIPVQFSDTDPASGMEEFLSDPEEQTETQEDPIDIIDELELAITDEDVESALAEWKLEGDNDYYLKPESSTEILTEKAIEDFSTTELRLMRNEIAARHGWDFSDLILKSYFCTQKWYEPLNEQNEMIQFNAMETANMELIKKVENRDQEPVDYRTLNQLIELPFGGEYVFNFDGLTVTVRVAEDTVSLFADEERLAEYYRYYENSKVLIYNQKDESQLFISGMSGENDNSLTEKYIINQNGIEWTESISGIIVSYTRNAFCRNYEGGEFKRYAAYEWMFYQKNEWIPKGRAISGGRSYLVLVELPCYLNNNGSLQQMSVKPGETVEIKSIDHRNKKVTWYEFSWNGQKIYTPDFWMDDGIFEACTDGISFHSHFERW